MINICGESSVILADNLTEYGLMMETMRTIERLYNNVWPLIGIQKDFRMPIERLNRILYNKEGIDNMKLIAMAIKGKEYLHSRQNAFFVSDRSAKKICEIMNNVKFRIKNDSETWHIYDYDFTQESYVTGKLTIYKGIVKLKAL